MSQNDADNFFYIFCHVTLINFCHIFLLKTTKLNLLHEEVRIDDFNFMYYLLLSLSLSLFLTLSLYHFLSLSFSPSLFKGPLLMHLMQIYGRFCPCYIKISYSDRIKTHLIFYDVISICSFVVHPVKYNV